MSVSLRDNLSLYFVEQGMYREGEEEVKEGGAGSGCEGEHGVACCFCVFVVLQWQWKAALWNVIVAATTMRCWK